MKQVIKHRLTGLVLFECEADTFRDAIIKAVNEHENLRDADLRGANLRGANLRDADLRDAYLGDANLSDANLRGANLSVANLRDAYLGDANLSGANLSGANLSDANLRCADLSGANLSDANLRGADLSGANLRDANLRCADLSGAYLRGAKEDFFAVLDLARLEVPGLYKSLMDGRINGSAYEGECACLVGTIAKVRQVDFKNLGLLQPNAGRPAEKWFLAIRKGDTPENSQVSAITVEWLQEFAKRESIALPVREVMWREA